MPENAPETILDTLGAALPRWTMGAAAAPQATIWRAELGHDPAEAELRLLALAGQFLATCVMAQPPSPLQPLAEVPRLTLPTVPETLRPLVRRTLGAAREVRPRTDLLQFLTLRGWTVHPADWMPAAGDEDAPDVYAPWRDWADRTSGISAGHRPAGDRLTAESWDEFWPAARKVALTTLRRRDPDTARALLAARLSSLGAEERLRLVGVLAARLSEADTDFLTDLAASDRAPKVKALATSLLARLGCTGTVNAEEAAELAAFCEFRTKGLLRRTRVLGLCATKTPAQVTRRRQLFNTVDLAAFAAALGIEADELPELWPWRERADADLGFITMAARSGSDRQIGATAQALAAAGPGMAMLAAELRPRLSRDQQSLLARNALATGETFSSVLAIIGGCGEVENLITAPAGTALLHALGADDAQAARNTAAISGELNALGLIASRGAAVVALEQIGRNGVATADPRLDMLRLNAALDHSPARASKEDL